MPKNQFDTLDFSLDLYKRQKQTMAFKAKTPAEARKWQKALRARLKSLLGGFPSVRSPLSPRILETRKLKEYTRETVVFQSRPNLSVFGYFFLPKDYKAPGPCVICLHGHGRGVDAISGFKRNGKMRRFGKWEEYQMDFALQCVSQGYAVFAMEILGFGHRRDHKAALQYQDASSCQPASGAALLFGETMQGWRVWDVMRALDYLETRPEVDPGRLGVMGISGGGTIILYSSALDDRIKASVMSCSFNTYRDSIVSISHCMDGYIPGLLKVAEMSDIAGLIAPRAAFVEAGAKDDIFPVFGVRSAYKETQKVYRCLGAQDRWGLEVFNAEHRFWGKGAFQFLKRSL